MWNRTCFGRFCLTWAGICAQPFFPLAPAITAATTVPVSVVYRNSIKEISRGMGVANEALYRGWRYDLMRMPKTSSEDFQNLYVLDHRRSFFVDNQGWGRLGETLLTAPGDFSVIRLNPEMLPEAAALAHQQGRGCGALFRLYGDMVRAPEGSFEPLIGPETRLDSVLQAVQKVDKVRIQQTVADLVAFGTRYHKSESGQKVPGFLQKEYAEVTGSRPEVSTELWSHGRETPQNSLIVRIPGKGPKAHEKVILGSHLDSIAFFRGAAPGADDNASGTATNLELFRVLLESGWTFQRTIEIHAYAAEEIGLVGSQDIARTYKEKGVQVAAMLQFDMNLFQAQGAPDQIFFVTDDTDAGLNRFLGKLVDSYLQVPHFEETLSAGTSDHRSWFRHGYFTAFPFENPLRHNPSIHSKSDTIENAPGFTQARAFVQLGLSFLAHVAGLIEESSSKKQ